MNLQKKSLQLLNLNVILYFTIVCLVGILINLYISSFHYSVSIVQSTYSEILAYKRIEEMVERQHRLEWLTYILVPVIIAFKIFYFGCAQSISTAFAIDRFNLSKNLNIVLKSEIVFCLMLIARIIFIETFLKLQTLNDLSYIPLSLINYINISNIPKFLIYPIQLVNIWELLYAGLSVLLIRNSYAISTVKSIKIFLLGYLPSLFLWVTIIIFLTIQFG